MLVNENIMDDNNMRVLDFKSRKNKGTSTIPSYLEDIFEEEMITS